MQSRPTRPTLAHLRSLSARAALIGASAISLVGASAPAHAAPGDSDQGLFYRLGVGLGYGSLGADAALVDD